MIILCLLKIKTFGQLGRKSKVNWCTEKPVLAFEWIESEKCIFNFLSQSETSKLNEPYLPCQWNIRVSRLGQGHHHHSEAKLGKEEESRTCALSLIFFPATSYHPFIFIPVAPIWYKLLGSWFDLPKWCCMHWCTAISKKRYRNKGIYNLQHENSRLFLVPICFKFVKQTHYSQIISLSLTLIKT